VNAAGHDTVSKCQNAIGTVGVEVRNDRSRHVLQVVPSEPGRAFSEVQQALLCCYIPVVLSCPVQAE